MASTAVYVKWFLFGMMVADVVKAAAMRELSTSPVAVKSQDKMWQTWLKITAVPLAVFLLGACVWGCIKKSVVWKLLLKLTTCERRAEVSIALVADAMPAAGLRPNNSSQHGPDLEEGCAASNHRIGDGPAIPTQTCDVMQQPTLQSANDGGNLPAADVAPPL